MKKTFAFLLAAVLLVSLAGCGAAAPPAEKPGPYLAASKVTLAEDIPSPLALREKPEADSRVLFYLPDVPATFYSPAEQDGWVQICLGEKLGWLPKEALEATSLSAPVPEFLPAELQLLYLRALTLFELYSPHASYRQTMGCYCQPAESIYLENENSWLSKDLVYLDFSAWRSALEQVFTPEYAQQEFELSSKEGSSFRQQTDGLWFLTTPSESYEATVSGFSLTEQTPERIAFDMLLTFGVKGDWTCRMPIEFVNTQDGWRVSQFSSPLDQSRWSSAMGEGFDIPEALGYHTVKELSADGKLLRTEQTDPDGWLIVSEYDADGKEPIRIKTYEPDGTLSSLEELVFDESTGSSRKSHSVILEETGGYLFSEYDEARHLIKASRYGADYQLKGSSVYTYDGELLTLRTEFGPNDEVLQESRYEYDPDGQITKESSLCPAEQRSSYILYDYGDRGQLLKSTQFVNEQLVQEDFFDKQGNHLRTERYSESGQPAGSTHYEYSEQGLLTRQDNFSEDGVLTSSEVTEYNSNGLIQRRSIFGPADENGRQTLLLEQRYSYQENGMLRKS